jgi:hypothetical protein
VLLQESTLLAKQKAVKKMIWNGVVLTVNCASLYYVPTYFNLYRKLGEFLEDTVSTAYASWVVKTLFFIPCAIRISKILDNFITYCYPKPQYLKIESNNTHMFTSSAIEMVAMPIAHVCTATALRYCIRVGEAVKRLSQDMDKSLVVKSTTIPPPPFKFLVGDGVVLLSAFAIVYMFYSIKIAPKFGTLKQQITVYQTNVRPNPSMEE